MRRVAMMAVLVALVGCNRRTPVVPPGQSVPLTGTWTWEGPGYRLTRMTVSILEDSSARLRANSGMYWHAIRGSWTGDASQCTVSSREACAYTGTLAEGFHTDSTHYVIFEIVPGNFTYALLFSGKFEDGHLRGEMEVAENSQTFGHPFPIEFSRIR